MSKKLLFILIIVILVSLLLFASAGICGQEEEKGTYSIYFMNEQVGYEEFVWRTVERGYELEVMGQITKPVSVQIERLLVQLDKDFIPLGYQFKGVLSGTKQSISSTISDGTVHNIIHVEGQKQERTFQIKRDSFLLSNPIFSLYMVITKKFQCSLKKEKTGLSAYIIPQTEITFSLSPRENEPCLLDMKLGATVIELKTDKQGTLNRINVPSQNIRVVLE